MIDGDVLKFLRRKADFFEGFANALPELQRIAACWSTMDSMRQNSKRRIKHVRQDYLEKGVPCWRTTGR